MFGNKIDSSSLPAQFFVPSSSGEGQGVVNEITSVNNVNSSLESLFCQSSHSETSASEKIKSLISSLKTLNDSEFFDPQKIEFVLNKLPQKTKNISDAYLSESTKREMFTNVYKTHCISEKFFISKGISNSKITMERVMALAKSICDSIKKSDSYEKLNALLIDIERTITALEKNKIVINDEYKKLSNEVKNIIVNEMKYSQKEFSKMASNYQAEFENLNVTPESEQIYATVIKDVNGILRNKYRQDVPENT